MWNRTHPLRHHCRRYLTSSAAVRHSPEFLHVIPTKARCLSTHGLVAAGLLLTLTSGSAFMEEYQPPSMESKRAEDMYLQFNVTPEQVLEYLEQQVART